MSTNTDEAGGSRRTRDTPPARDAEAIRTDIEQTRADLGDSLQELAYRADVTTRTKQKITEVRGRAVQVIDRATHPAQLAAVRAKDTAKQAATKARQVTARATPPAQVAAVRAKDTAKQAAMNVRQRPAPFAGVVAGLAAAVAAVMLLRRPRAAKARTRGWWSGSRKSCTSR
jgi:Protein of unknown function (DUF3618)